LIAFGLTREVVVESEKERKKSSSRMGFKNLVGIKRENNKEWFVMVWKIRRK